MRAAAYHSCYELIAVYVDDLEIQLKSSESFLKILTYIYGFKWKVSQALFHFILAVILNEMYIGNFSWSQNNILNIW